MLNFKKFVKNCFLQSVELCIYNCMNKNLVIIIPSRLGSTRLKNKNILLIKGMPMFVYVALEALKSKYKPTVFISSESQKTSI